MEAAQPLHKGSVNPHGPGKKQKPEKPVVVPLPVTEVANLQTQKPESTAVTAGSANPYSNRMNLNGTIAPVHGSKTIYDQGAEIRYGKFQESLAQTGDINHPDTKKLEKSYISTLNISQIRDYHNLKNGTYLPKTLDEQAAAYQAGKSSSEAEVPAASGSDASVEITPVVDIAAESGMDEGFALPEIQEDAVRTTPTSSNSDPRFNQTVGLVKSTAKAKRAHATKEKAENHANAAAAVPAGERKSKAKGLQVEQLDQQKTGSFSATGFKVKLRDKIKSINLPVKQGDAENFKNRNNINAVNGLIKYDVMISKNSVTGAIETVARQQPDETKVALRTATALPDPKIGSKVSIRATEAMPPKRGDSELSQPIAKSYKSVEQQFARNHITDEQLAKSNEPDFINALNAKKAAKANAEQAPGEFKNAESKKLEASKREAQGKTNSTMDGMHQSRKGLLDSVTNKQHKAGEKNTAKHQEVVDKLNAIYAETKKTVDGQLGDLETKVAQLFDDGAKKAKDAFEKEVTQKLEAYKARRYGEWYDVRGYGNRIEDAWNKKLPDEVDKYYKQGKDHFMTAMDGVITKIAELVTTRLNAAKASITAGRQKVVSFIKNLPADVRKAVKGDIDAIQGQFKELENSISDKESSLIDSLASKYNNALKEVDELIVDIKKRNRGFLAAVEDATVGLAKTIMEIRKTLTELLSGAVSAVLAIVADPIGFLSHLIAGVSQGFTNFGTNIWTHLKTGFFGWLTGAMKGISFTMPEDVFSLKGIFSITSQVLGLTWGGIRAIGARVIGESVMKVLETASEKGLEVVQVVRKDGAAGLWEYLKDQFADLKATVMDAMMDIIQTQVIQAGIKWVMGLLTPVGAFIKAAMAIIDVVKFFIQRAAQIMELIKAFTDSIKAIASGNVGAVAKSIENALGKAVPVLIGFLASLLGIGGLADKVLGVIRKIRMRIENAIVKFWNFIKGKAGKLLSKIGVGGKKDKKEKKTVERGKISKGIEWWNDKIAFENVENAKHTLYFKGEGKDAKLYMQSKDDHVMNHLNNAKKAAGTKSEEESVNAGIAHYQNEVLPLNYKLNKLEGDRIKLTNDNKDGKNDAKIEANEKATKEQNKLQDVALETLAKLFKAIKFDDEVQPTTVKTTVTSKQDSMGRALEVEANPLTWMPGNTKGSSPYQNPLGWDHATEDIRNTIYIRGHMLNDNIHGPGATWNLVPITRVMNSNMEVKAESIGKQVLSEKGKHMIMWYKTKVVDYHKPNDNENDKYFPQEIRIEWGYYKNKEGNYDAKGEIVDKNYADFKQGKPAMPYNINDLGEKLLVDKLNLNPKFAKAVTEERKTEKGAFEDIRKFEERMTDYYLNRKDKDILNSELDEIDSLEKNNKITF
ncbi:hypothetical protein [uncultured Chryseobacterium sp.]|uniref:hypothetical protein n=1 Tax=uncultured Chryseobacterium sp. TaxID=259322 RepID=UPI0025E7FE6A|nr:hypothetical protein [uncultured Chryseobacterium sp.]